MVEDKKSVHMVIIGFKGTEFNPLSFYSTGKPLMAPDGAVNFHDPMQESDVHIAAKTFSFFSVKEITDEEYEEHKKKYEEQEKMEAMYQPTTG